MSSFPAQQAWLANPAAPLVTGIALANGPALQDSDPVGVSVPAGAGGAVLVGGEGDALVIGESGGEVLIGGMAPDNAEAAPAELVVASM